MAKYDNNLLVIGAGSAGLIAALIAATVRARVTLVERDQMGGDCLNTGCVPSKTLIASAKAAHALREAERYGIGNVTGVVDFGRVMQRVRKAVETIAPKDSTARYRSLGVDCKLAEARIVGPHLVQVGDERVSTRRIVLAAGAAPLVPAIPGLERVAALTSENLWQLETLPPRLLVLGGGPIGCELAQAFARLGAEVTLVDMESRLLPREDARASELVTARFEAEGIRVLTGHKAVRFEPVTALGGAPAGGAPADSNEAGAHEAGRLVTEHAGVETTTPFDRVLVAVGRKARSDGLAGCGIELNQNGTVKVDEYLRTSMSTVYACGDIAGPYQFTHMAAHQAWYAAVNALAAPFWKIKADYSVVPWATYTDPEVARVGMSAEEAAERGIDADVTEYPIDDVDRAITDGRTEGFVKVVSKGKKILGATIVSAHAGELIAEFVLAMTHGLSLKQVLGTIHVYPTMMEANKMAAGAWRRANAPAGLLDISERLFGMLR